MSDAEGSRREIVSFVRRSARLRPGMRKSWDAHHERWVINVPYGVTDSSIAPGFSLDLAAEFGRTAPLIVEIGSGMGESLVPMAKARPDANVLAFEVYRPAVARTLAKLAKQEVSNVRAVVANAVDGLRLLVAPESLDQLWLFFPDPWHKSRHNKRRLVTTDFADLVASRMKPGAEWRLATDWADYGHQMREVLDDHPRFENLHPGGWAPRWPERPVTKFEQRGLDAGRQIFDLTYRRV